ncbi:MAG TPA: ATP-binding protein [Myxococcota bacterium]|nr:ATP-binding protein [Myxococcota bacterium]
MTETILALELRRDPDVVLTRQCARSLAASLGFDVHDQTRIATAVSEAARVLFVAAGAATAAFALHGGARPLFVARISAAEVPSVEDPGVHAALVAGRRLLDAYEERRDGGTWTIELGQRLPAGVWPLPPQRLQELTASLPGSADTLAELRQQNYALLAVQEELRVRQDELTRLNGELAETNSGVLALYAELEDKAEALRRSSESKARVYSEMNHEVRTPINAILSLTDLLLRESFGPLTEAQRKPVQLVRKSAQSLSDLVDDMLDLAKFEAGKMTLHLDRMRVSELFGTLRGMFRAVHASEAVALVFEPTEHLPRLVTDERKLAQILRNFIANALKFTERGEVRVRAAQLGDEVEFSVRDTGIGISAQDQKLLFADYTQIDSPRQRKVKGTGLGLAVSRRLAELLGGRVTVESAEGVGSVFHVYIPLALRGDSSERGAEGSAEARHA